MNVKLFVENDLIGQYISKENESSVDFKLTTENSLTDEQADAIHAVHRVMNHIQTVIDLPAVQKWCAENQAKAMLFGSRTKNLQRKDSDLDVIVFANETIQKQQIPNYLETHHGEFQTFLKQPIKLDFKLDTCDTDCYAGFTYTGKNEIPEELDYIFAWDDIPSFIYIEHDFITFDITSISDVLDGDEFKKNH